MGQPDTITAIKSPADEIDRLKGELRAARAKVTELEARADIDPLLDTLNRRGFERELARSIAYVKRYGTDAVLIYLDLDGFKAVNDRCGHSAGDELLKAVAIALAGKVRASDVVGRLGGDEFALLLWNLSETDARAKAAVLEADIDALTFTFDGQSITAGASAGVTILGPSSDAARALEEADSAMYVRKAQRRHELPADRAGSPFTPAAQTANPSKRRHA